MYKKNKVYHHVQSSYDKQYNKTVCIKYVGKYKNL